jgi:VanZ family protein
MNSHSLTRQRDAQSFRRRALRYAPVIIWMSVIWFASTGEFSAANTSRVIGPLVRWLFPDISPEALVAVHALVRKAAHFCAYAVLGFFAAYAFSTSSRETVRRAWFRWSLLLVVGYALIDEYHQSFVPTRSASIYDSFIDMAGGFTILLVYAALRRRRATRAQHPEAV